jgi:hypothetical protein
LAAAVTSFPRKKLCLLKSPFLWRLVGSGTAAATVGNSLAVSRVSPCVPVQEVPQSRFQFPPHRTRHADLPHYALLHRFAARVMGPFGLSGCSRRSVGDSECAHQPLPLLALRGTQRHPSAARTANPTELKAEESKALALREVDSSTLVFIHRDLELGELLAQPSLHRQMKPALPRMHVDEHYQIVSEPSVFDARPPLLAGDLLCSLQHRVHLVEVDITEQRQRRSC